MSLCSHNLSLGILADVEDGHVNIKKDKFGNQIITGFIGKIFDQFLVHKNRRNCNFIPIKTLQTDFEDDERNSSAIYLMENNLLDLFGYPLRIGLEHELLETSKVISVERSMNIFPTSNQLAQFLKQPIDSKKVDLSSFLVEYFYISLIILFGYFLLLIFILTIPKLVNHNFNRLKSLNLILFKVLFMDLNQLTKFSLKFAFIFLFYYFFLFFNLNFLSSSIRTDKVVIDTGEIIDSLPKLMDTQKILGIGIGISQGKNDSFLKKIYFKKLEADQLISKTSKMTEDERQKFMRKIYEIGLDSFIFFNKDINLYYGMSRFTPLTSLNGLVGYLKPKSYYEILEVFYMRKNLDETKKKFIHKNLEQSFENGLISNWFDQIKKVVVSETKKNLRIFESTEEFIDYYSSEIPFDVKLGNFATVFICFFTFLTLILAAFVTSVMWAKKKKVPNRTDQLADRSRTLRKVFTQTRLICTFAPKLKRRTISVGV